MSRALDPGSVIVRARVAAGQVVGADIVTERPLALARRFCGRPVAEVVDAVSLLHAVCGVSHAAALQFAAASAADLPLGPAERRRWLVRLAAERVAEHLRELFLGEADTSRLAVIREALAAAQAVARAGGAFDVARVSEAMQLLDEPAPVAVSLPSSTLVADDDAAVVEGLVGEADFERRPHLDDRQPEVGPAARLGFSAAHPEATRAARLAELRAAVQRLEAANRPETRLSASGWMTTNRTGERRGYAAVESPRGRLYYLVTVDREGRLVDARVLAPTEWNFHPAGPFAAALVGLRPAGDPLETIAQLASAFCPCVAVQVSLADA